MAYFPATCITSLILISLSPVAVAAPPETTEVVEKDGLRFRYLTRLEERERVRISGQFLPSGEDFNLIVRPNGRVDGTVGDRTVEFSIGKKRHDGIVAWLQNERDKEKVALSVIPASPAGK